jgi:hypothetical protein
MAAAATAKQVVLMISRQAISLLYSKMGYWPIQNGPLTLKGAITNWRETQR